MYYYYEKFKNIMIDIYNYIKKNNPVFSDINWEEPTLY